MTQFIITYLGGDQPASPEEGRKHFAKYQQWLAALGSAAVSPMNPIKNTHTVHADASVTQGSSTVMSGYTIVEAGSIEDAISMAKECPFLEINGTLEVSELIKMGGGPNSDRFFTPGSFDGGCSKSRQDEPRCP